MIAATKSRYMKKSPGAEKAAEVVSRALPYV